MVIFFIVGYQDLSYRDTFVKTPISATNTISDIDRQVIEQQFTPVDNQISEVGVQFGTYGRKNKGYFILEILQNNQVLYQTTVAQEILVDNGIFTIKFEKPLKLIDNGIVTLRIKTSKTEENQSATVWFNEVDKDSKTSLYLNGNAIEGELCFTYTTVKPVPFGEIVALITLLLLIIVGLLYQSATKALKEEKTNLVLVVLDVVHRYQYLLKQLVSRDFKTKYRRSVLGVFWSFLNPLLTMLIQYIVFSSIFRSSILNYPVYLLTGIVTFNALSESSNMALSAIVSNFSLINKVKVPLYIFPISRVLMSSINLILSLLPLTIVILLTGTPIDYRIVFIPFGLVFLVLFLMGVGLILATLMVFFRDIQFLWSVFLLVWMYATPIFYPASIIPARYGFILTLNPIYYFIRFFRSIILEQAIPSITVLIPIVVVSIITFFIGIAIFKRFQERFVYYN